MAPTPDADPQSTATPAWTRLQLSRRRTKSDLPPLFYKLMVPERASTPNTPRMVLHCTDLTILYTASLTHANILAEATRQHSPIDPSESSKQFAVLLDYLSQSLASKDNVLARTPASEDFMALEAADEGDFSSDLSSQVALRTTIALPRPLRPLSFAFTLTRQEPAAFSRVVLRPALLGTQMAKRKLDKLVDVVRDKDHVIARLLERVGSQASGDMSLVFPTLTGRRGRGGEKVGVDEAGKLVPGLKEFELGVWEAEQGVEHGAGVEGLVLEGGLPETLGKEEGIGAWVRRLPGPEALEHDNSVDGKRRLSRQVTRDTTRGSQADGDKGDEDDDATESEDEFERQPTPPSANKAAGSTKTTPQKSASAAPKATESSASLGEDDSGPPAKKQKTSVDGVSSGRRAGRLGGLRGGQNKRPERKASSSPEQNAASAAPAAASEDDDNTSGKRRRPSTASTATASATDSKAEPPPPTTRSSKKIAVGGSKRQPTPPTASPSPDPVPSETASPAKTKGRLGRLGKKGRDTDTYSRSSSVETGDRPGQAVAGDGTPTRHRLGKLGGPGRGRKAAAGLAAEETESEEDATAAAATTTAGGGHTGDKPAQPEALSTQRAGQHKKASPALDKREHHKEGGEKVQNIAEPEPEPREPETAEQAAARRREELKRTAAKAPAKKKRRF